SCGNAAVATLDNLGPTSFGSMFSGVSSAAAAIISSIEASNSIFLTQSTAFVSAPPNPKPDSEGGGVWARGVGGEVRYKNDTTVNFNLGVGNPNGVTGCPTQFRHDFGGFQLGQDIAKLNVMGWNLHVGQTAGYLQTNGRSTDAGAVPFSTTTQVPFIGA